LNDDDPDKNRVKQEEMYELLTCLLYHLPWNDLTERVNVLHLDEKAFILQVLKMRESINRELCVFCYGCSK